MLTEIANEFLVDYHEESYRPDVLPLATARGAALVPRPWSDSCNREIGIFEAYGSCRPTVRFLRETSAWTLTWSTRSLVALAYLIIFGSLVPEYVYRRKKVRAQVGSDEVGGVLATCLDRGIDQGWLRHRFAVLHDVEDESELDRFMRAGRYRTGIPSSTQEH